MKYISDQQYNRLVDSCTDKSLLLTVKEQSLDFNQFAYSGIAKGYFEKLYETVCDFRTSGEEILSQLFTMCAAYKQLKEETEKCQTTF